MVVTSLAALPVSATGWFGPPDASGIPLLPADAEESLALGPE
ncbi:hypothetical protein [Porphyrobacter sp. GA68]|nr:hypothetical protein [Porphyrobacter sp. GA68]